MDTTISLNTGGLYTWATRMQHASLIFKISKHSKTQGLQAHSRCFRIMRRKQSSLSYAWPRQIIFLAQNFVPQFAPEKFFHRGKMG
jgi:hypothetical protein